MKRSSPNKRTVNSGLKRDTTLRVHRKTILFNDKEIEALEMYCKKYKISSQSKFIREAVVTTILKQLEEDHPKLF